MDNLAQEIAQFREAGDYQSLLNTLEDYEIAAVREGGQALFAQQLACYLILNELPAAKFLWKRVPTEIKAADDELQALWDVGRQLWLKEFAAAFEQLQAGGWSSDLQPLIDAIQDSLRARNTALIVEAYSTVTADKAASLLGLNQQQLAEFVEEKGWTAQGEYVTPAPENTNSSANASAKALKSLAGVVSTLEN